MRRVKTSWFVMPTEKQFEINPQALRLYQMEFAIESLNARIARLAIGLGVSLTTEGEVVRVMSRHQMGFESQERHIVAERRDAARTSSDRRLAYKFEELRGLLVLRYGVETRYVDEVGIATTRQILVEAEAQLVREGFKPGADGLDLDRLFSEN